jgi:aminotransferase MxcL
MKMKIEFIMMIAMEVVMNSESAPTGLPPRTASSLVLERSRALADRAAQCIPGMTLSMMKRPEHFSPGAFPVYLATGQGALVTDVDGNEYIDFICGLGANSLGHRHPALVEAVRAELECGFIHSLPCEQEITTAEALIGVVPHAEMARFFKTGADATSAAVRLARAITGRERVVTVGYNGWHDHFMFDTPGVPRALAALTQRMPLFTPADEQPLLQAVAQGRQNDLAAVLISLPYNRLVTAEFLTALREACTDSGVLLIFDEIVTGFRLALGGAQQHFGVRADFACYSKALAAGMPLSAVVGERRHLERMEKLQVSTTFGGELLSLAACRAALAIYRQPGFIDQLNVLGRRLREGVNRVARESDSPLEVRGYDSLPFFVFDRDPARHAETMRVFQGEMAARRVLLRRDINFICGAHTAAQIDYTIEAAGESLLAMSQGARARAVAGG